MQRWIYEGRGAGGYVPPPAPSPRDVLQLHGDTKSAVSFAMYSQNFTPCHCPVITLLLQQSIKSLAKYPESAPYNDNDHDHDNNNDD